MKKWILKSTDSKGGTVLEWWHYGKLRIQREGEYHYSASRIDKKGLTEKDESNVVERFNLQDHRRIVGGAIKRIQVGGAEFKVPSTIHWIDFENYPDESPWSNKDLVN